LISSKELPLHCKQFSTTTKVNLLVEKSKRLQRFLNYWYKKDIENERLQDRLTIRDLADGRSKYRT
jgi:hypothetical protein